MSKLFVSGLLAIVFTCATCAAPRDTQWKKVDDAIQRGLPTGFKRTWATQCRDLPLDQSSFTACSLNWAS